MAVRRAVANCCFPFLPQLGLAFVRNYLALPFLALCLFKIGMPEILSYGFTALLSVTDLAQLNDSQKLRYHSRFYRIDSIHLNLPIVHLLLDLSLQ